MGSSPTGREGPLGRPFFAPRPAVAPYHSVSGKSVPLAHPRGPVEHALGQVDARDARLPVPVRRRQAGAYADLEDAVARLAPRAHAEIFGRTVKDGLGGGPG